MHEIHRSLSTPLPQYLNQFLAFRKPKKCEGCGRDVHGTNMDNPDKCMERVNFCKNAVKRKIKCLANNQDLEKQRCIIVIHICFLIAVMFLQRH